MAMVSSTRSGFQVVTCSFWNAFDKQGSYKIGKGLAFDGAAQAVINIKLAQLHGPFDQPFRAFWLLACVK